MSLLDFPKLCACRCKYDFLVLQLASRRNVGPWCTPNSGIDESALVEDALEDGVEEGTETTVAEHLLEESSPQIAVVGQSDRIWRDSQFNSKSRAS